MSTGPGVWCWLLSPDDPTLVQRLYYLWLANPKPPQRAHVVICMNQSQGAEQGLEPGFHRAPPLPHRSCPAQFLVTRCVALACQRPEDQLKSLQFEADEVYLGITAAITPRFAKALADCCRVGALMHVVKQLSDLHQQHLCFEYQPQGQHRWTRPTARRARAAHIMSPSHAVVVGAGLAGASTAYALAERGWQVLVLDAAPSASAGASGVPAGLMSPLISEDNNPRSRLIRAGMRLTRQHAEKLLRPGLDWQASGVLEKLGQGTSSDQTERWHADGAWIKPQALIAQWLAHPLVQLQTETQVTRLLLTETQGWEVQDAAGGTVAQAPLMVLAHSLAAFEMASPWLNTKVQPIGVQGLVSWGWRQQTDWPSYPLHPVNGLGSFIPSVPYGPKAPAGNGDIWLSGATYLKQTDATPNADSQASQHLDNLRRLHTLWPSAAQLLEPQFQTSPDKPKVWSGVRAVLPHRLPFAGPLARGLWLHAGLGSRGLSLCVLGAELIACRIAGEPWPIDRDLARHLLKPTVQA